MKFAVITHVEHKYGNKTIFGYSPYVQEMNLWFKYVDEVCIVAPLISKRIEANESYYIHNKLTLKRIPSLNLLSTKSLVRSLFSTPYILFKIYKAMKWADHIHLRCPGNIGLLGCIVQILFPQKLKTVKYAGNWDPNSKQPWSYRLQKWILSNTFLTKNAKVLVYGNWPNLSKNIVPFFTATYSENDLLNSINNKLLSKDTLINLLFVGNLSLGKQPLLTVKVVQELEQRGYKVKLNIYGDGAERERIENYIKKHNLKNVHLHGNASKEVVKKAYQNAHFLVFLSKSEGWPKVVAEAMFWGCLPITTNVSCISDILGNQTRGTMVNDDLNDIVPAIEKYIQNEKEYNLQVQNAMKWSRSYTLERFEKEIVQFL